MADARAATPPCSTCGAAEGAAPAILVRCQATGKPTARRGIRAVSDPDQTPCLKLVGRVAAASCYRREISQAWCCSRKRRPGHNPVPTLAATVSGPPHLIGPPNRVQAGSPALTLPPNKDPGEAGRGIQQVRNAASQRRPGLADGLAESLHPAGKPALLLPASLQVEQGVDVGPADSVAQAGGCLAQRHPRAQAGQVKATTDG